MSFVVFFVFLASGLMMRCMGAYIIVDNGYPKQACFVPLLHTRVSRNHVLWSEWLESVHKDVECCFGILKMRWRFLRNPIDYHDAHVIEAAFK